MSEYTLQDYFEHLGACEEGLEFVRNSGASSLSKLFSEMDENDGTKLDFVSWTLATVTENIPRSSDVGMEVRKLACLCANTVCNRVQCAESPAFADSLQELAKWCDIELCDTADYAHQVKDCLESATCYEQGREAVKNALTELSPEFDRVWGLVTAWFDANSPPRPMGTIVPVLDRMGACSESKEFFRGYRSTKEAFDALDPSNARHRRWWFWIASALCKETQDSGALETFLGELHEFNSKNSKHLEASLEIGKLVGTLLSEGCVSKNSDSAFYALNVYFDYDLTSLFEETQSELQSLWDAYVEQEDL